ncbi:unnamed protein product [Lactuca saligna]|uniref:Uncharacterized protein n=1 Tax=Lactuca saligna TaxID=75948 RepID=A0AA35ZNM6_LACSI|nr:unnamed protein product [Lactuca saligna]
MSVAALMLFCMLWKMSNISTVFLSRSLMSDSVMTTCMYDISSGASFIIFCLNWLMLVNVFWTKANDSYIVSSWFCIMTSIFCVLCLLVKPMSLLWDFIMEYCGCWMVLIRDN